VTDRLRAALGPWLAAAIATLTFGSLASAPSALALPANMHQLAAGAASDGGDALDPDIPSAPAVDEARDLPPLESRPDPGSGPPPASTYRAPELARAAAARTRLLKRLGPTGVVAIDRVTEAPRLIARLGATLTGPTEIDPAAVTMRFVRSNEDLFGLDSADLRTLKLTDRYVAPGGLTTMHWHQRVDGIELVNEELAAGVDSRGRLVQVVGPARPDLADTPTDPSIGSADALSIAAADAGVEKSTATTGSATGADRSTRFVDGDSARLVLYGDAGGPRLAWEVDLDADSQHYDRYDVDAATGGLLSRHNLVASDSVKTWDSWPLASTFGSYGGGNPQVRPLKRLGNGMDDPWRYDTTAAPYNLPFQTLAGNQAFLLLDFDDDDGATANEYFFVHPSNGSENFPDWIFNPSYFNNQAPLRCPPGGRCTWSPVGQYQNFFVNAYQNGTQVYWFVNQFHDHLEAPPIGFTEASGNFEKVNQDGLGGRQNDDVFLQALDGANTNVGYPDAAHVNNANMLTLEDGKYPTMQMYLFTQFPAGQPPPDPGSFEVDGGDDAPVVYHEYTHGLSNRLVGGPNTAGTLTQSQAGAMGEAWSDWYAYDYLVGQGLIPDNPNRSGELVQGLYENFKVVRSEALDCAVGASKKKCPGKKGGKAGHGGYTYGDYGKVLGDPEIHADGEIWGQTLWDLRTALIKKYGEAKGMARAELLITNGLRLSPIQPSYLDARDAILQADAAARDFNAKKVIWKTFARRGMGSNARTSGAKDKRPKEGFKNPTKRKRKHHR
jgi:extracellular elastinolytic metalloproteinase